MQLTSLKTQISKANKRNIPFSFEWTHPANKMTLSQCCEQVQSVNSHICCRTIKWQHYVKPVYNVVIQQPSIIKYGGSQIYVEANSGYNFPSTLPKVVTTLIVPDTYDILHLLGSCKSQNAPVFAIISDVWNMKY